jgi:methylamine dehydrogenase accessory protein MauD
LALLVVFTVVIARAMALGEEPECHCFGAIHSARAGWWVLSRNLALAGVTAVVAVAGPGESVGAALRGVDTAILAGVLALVVVLVAQAAFSWQLLRQNGRLLERVRALEESGGSSRPAPGLPVGDHAPAFALADLDGVTHTLADLLAPGLPVALAFSEPDCQACASLVPQLARLRATRAGELEVALITRGSSAENRTRLGAGALPTVLLQHEREVATRFGVASVPSAMVVAPDGQVASRLAVGQLAIEELLSSHGAPVAVSVLHAAGAGR